MAFSGKVTLKDDEKEYTEAGLNGFSEDKLPTEFEKMIIRYCLLRINIKQALINPNYVRCTFLKN